MKASIFLPDINKPLVFIPCGNPYKFSVNFKDRQMFISKGKNSNSSTVYAMPGVKRVQGAFCVGLLLLDDMLFGKMCDIKSPVGKEIIFIHSPFSLGEFRVHKNPPNDIENSLVEEAKGLSKDLENLLVECFGLSDGNNFDKPPISVNTNTVTLEE